MIPLHTLALVAVAGKKPSELPTPTAPIVAADIFVAEQSDGLVVQTPLTNAIDAASDISKSLIPPATFANLENPTDAEALAYINGLTPVPKEGSIFYANPGIVVNAANGGQNPEIVWKWIDGEVTRTVDTPRAVEIPDTAFADTNVPTEAEVIAYLQVGANVPDLSGNIILPKFKNAQGKEWKWLLAGDYSDGVSVDANIELIAAPPVVPTYYRDIQLLAANQTSYIVPQGSLPTNFAQITITVQGQEFYEGANEDVTINATTGEVTFNQIVPTGGQRVVTRWVVYPV